MNRDGTDPDDLWARHSAEWRSTAQIASQWREARDTDRRSLASRATRGFWDILERLGATLFVTREYEHLVVALSARGGRPRTSFFPVPHPSGLVVDRRGRRLFLASTRNPNQVFTMKPVTGRLDRADVDAKRTGTGAFVPVASTSYPGSLYIHDLALIGGVLHANAVGHNAVATLEAEGRFRRVWWPRCVESRGRPVFSQNFIQLNSIAAGATLADSYFSASSTRMGRLRPGHRNYPVDEQGVIFSGRTREPICTGLTRPHSARLRGKRIWVANSGYGEVGFVRDGRLEVVQRLAGWTRGLCLVGDVVFVATSRVIPRYSRYAPGLDCAKARAGIHAVSLATGRLLGSLEWPHGNQVFAIDWIRDDTSGGFPFEARTKRRSDEVAFFYTYLTD